MAGNKNFSQTIQYKGQLDVSQIISSLQKIRNELANSSTLKGKDSLFINVDKEMKNIENLSAQLKAAIQKGFSNPKDVKDFERIVNSLDKSFNKVAVDLNGINACVNYDFNTICKNFQKYDVNVNHNNKNTISNIKNSGLNIIDGTLTFNISSFVKADNCKIKENNLIVNKTLEKCIITPNIFVDNYKVDSNICTNITNDENKLVNAFYKKTE